MMDSFFRRCFRILLNGGLEKSILNGPYFSNWVDLLFNIVLIGYKVGGEERDGQSVSAIMNTYEVVNAGATVCN
jgi:hypothetical protein